MRIAVDLTPIYDHLTGIERYNINIVKAMIKRHPEDVFVLVFKNEVHREFKKIIKQKTIEYLVLPACNKFLFIQLRLLGAMNKIRADYYLFLSFTSPFFFKKKSISAIHDLTCWDCPESIPIKMKYYYRLTYLRSVKKDWKTVTVSKFSQSRICKRYGIKEEQVPVIYDGLTEFFKEETSKSFETICEKYSIPDCYLLSLSTIEPRKNLQLLITAYQELINENNLLPDLVLAGRKGWKLEEILKNVDALTQKRIHFTGFVDDEDLPTLYRNAELFIFPSKYEGFGLPLIEAMSQGTLVLSSDAASLPEIIEENGELFESDNKEDLKRKLLRTLSLSETERNRIIEKAIQRAKFFNWDNEAERLHKIMKNGMEP